MDHTVERLAIDVDEKFAQYWQLVEKRRELKGRMEKAENEKRSVNERVFQRVFKEYVRELEEIESELEPIAKSLQSVRATVNDQIKDIDGQIEEIQDRLDEIAFRTRVGEFDAAASNELRAPLLEECETLSVRREQLTQSLSRMDTREQSGRPPKPETPPHADAHESAAQPRKSESPAATGARERTATPPRPVPHPRTDVRQPESQPRQYESSPRAEAREQKAPPKTPPKADAAPRAERREPAGSPHKPERRPVAPQAPDGTSERQFHVPAEEPSGDKEGFVDPTEWVGEFVRDEHPAPVESTFKGDPLFTKSAVGKDDSTDPDIEPDDVEDALAGLADPSEESAAGAAAAKRPDGRRKPQEPAFGDLPILTITDGPGAGKKLPLLPMTMTLGREVDNNIELKDVDVARYHARISFEAGDYVIQDLEGSSGTFVDGQRITRAILTPGSTIRVGGTELLFDMG
jgi:hypothetical protein